MTVILNVLSVVSILALVALGLAIVFGVMDIVNLAHGEFVTIGAFTLAVAQGVGGSTAYWAALLLAPLIGAALGLLLEATVIRFLYHRPLDTLLATYALSLILQKALELTFGKHPQAVQTPLPGTLTFLGTTYPSYRLFAIAVAALAIAGCIHVFARTRFGIELRAVIQNPSMAEAVGIDTKRLKRLAFCVGAGMASLAGVLVAPFAAVESQLGLTYLGKAFFVIVVGGIGSVAGSVVGSALVGSVETLLNYQLDPSLSSALVLVLAIALIRWRPQGLLPGFSATHHMLGKG
ncbi:urea ABC transporter permease subunit UrtB [Aquabacterium humicola]|uniref:urea ABC transporter permease subunit UrtB n=1 Tax=Aquabacterium humicola TaxID=3237377 RepID=UPI002542973C|nr:urea ABC transporter permease subunit UrtB [Rubrivivax pictus]